MTEKHHVCRFDETKLEEFFALEPEDNGLDAYHAPIMRCPTCGLLYFFMENLGPKGKRAGIGPKGERRPLPPAGFGVVELGRDKTPHGQRVPDGPFSNDRKPER